MNDTISTCHVAGGIKINDHEINDASLDVVSLCAQVGMVFQKHNPFSKSTYDNIAYIPRIHGQRDNKHHLDHIVQTSLENAGLCNEAKNRLEEPGTGLSGGQQRLCVACYRGQPGGRADG